MYKKIVISIMLVLAIICLILFKKDEPKLKKIEVEIKGAVKNTGVYQLELGSMVIDLINKGGGLTPDADTSILNLSKELKDEDVVIIYTNNEIEEMKQGSTSIKYIEKECVCPKLENSACFSEIIESSESIINKTSKVSLNTATLEELLTIPGIGESKAKLIIEYRNNTGFKKIEDIMNVKGVGSGIFEKIKAYITI